MGQRETTTCAPHPAPPARRAVPAYSTVGEGLALILRGYTLRIGLVVSGVVGTILSIVNQGSTLTTGHETALTWLRIATNYAVPFLVSSIGYVAPARRARGALDGPVNSATVSASARLRATRASRGNPAQPHRH